MSTEGVKVCLLPSALRYYERPLTGQNAVVYTITSNLLPLALHQTLQASLHVKTPLPLNIRTKKSNSFAWILPSHITAAFQKWALVTKGKLASPLDHDPKSPHYWSEHPRDKVFGANTKAFSSRFSGFSTCHPIYNENTMLLATRHAIYSAAVSTEETATFMLLPSWNKMTTTNPYASLCRKYPRICKFLGTTPLDQLQYAKVPFWNNIQIPLSKHSWELQIIAIWNT
jgi:hypothetical protein